MRRQQAAHSNSAWHLPRGDRTARTAASGRMTAPACCRHSRSRRELEVIAAATETPRGGERAHAVGAHVAEGHSLGGERFGMGRNYQARRFTASTAVDSAEAGGDLHLGAEN